MRLDARPERRMARKSCSFLWQRLDALERLTGLHFLPIRLKVRSVQLRPLLNAPPRLARRNLSCDKRSGKVEFRMLTRMFSVKMGWRVIPVEHPNHDAKERRDDRHDASLLGVLR